MILILRLSFYRPSWLRSHSMSVRLTEKIKCHSSDILGCGVFSIPQLLFNYPFDLDRLRRHRSVQIPEKTPFWKIKTTKFFPGLARDPHSCAPAKIGRNVRNLESRNKVLDKVRGAALWFSRIQSSRQLCIYIKEGYTCVQTLVKKTDWKTCVNKVVFICLRHKTIRW